MAADLEAKQPPILINLVNKRLSPKLQCEKISFDQVIQSFIITSSLRSQRADHILFSYTCVQETGSSRGTTQTS